MTTDAESAQPPTTPQPYTMRLSRLTVDKLGVKLYDKASAVVAELIANAYDADAENVTVTIPLGTALASKAADGLVADSGYSVSVSDDGHGMTPDEAQKYFLFVGADRRTRKSDGARSREKERPVMGRKGIGKLAPFGICRKIEVRSAGGPMTENGFLVSHFMLDFRAIVTDEEGEVPIAAGQMTALGQPIAGRRLFSRTFYRNGSPIKPRSLDRSRGDSRWQKTTSRFMLKTIGTTPNSVRANASSTSPSSRST